MRYLYLIIGVIIASIFTFGSAVAQSQHYFFKTSYYDDNFSSYHRYNHQPTATEEALSEEQLKMIRDRRLENMVSDPDDYTLDGDDASPKHKNSNKHKSTVHNKNKNNKSNDSDDNNNNDDDGEW